ncbi:MAG TPA: acyl-CoA dehydrogenase family protein [Thermoanaerobaculia bacterium]|nr:acyl-CoA dehydrogenase family protein [Thermoanaerobaculia bacterium]
MYASDNVETFRQEGLLGLTVPEQFGGLGANLSESTETLRTLAQGSPSSALMLAMHSSILANYRLDPASIPSQERDAFVEQRAWAFSEAVNGKLFAVANSETGAGGDVHNSRAIVTPESTLTGPKSFCSMGVNADYFMAAARRDGERVEYFLIRNDPRHIATATPWDGLGMRSSESVTLLFDHAPVLGYLCYRGMLDGANNRHWSTLAFTSIFIGAGESLLSEIAGRASSMLQKVAASDLELTLQASRSFLRHCVASEPAFPDDGYKRLVRDCKLFVTRSIAREASALFIAQSGSAYRFGSEAARKLRDILAGPMLRPTLGITFDSIWDELAAV